MFRSCCLNLLFFGTALPFHGNPLLDLQKGIAGGEALSHSLKAQKYSFHDFVQEFKREYAPGTDEWTMREQIFQAHVQKVVNLLAIPSLSWTPGFTKFMDYTAHEYSQLLGYKGRRSKAARTAMDPISFDKPMANLISTRLPFEYNVNLKGTLTKLVRDQGACGSCWAEAAVSTLEGWLQRNSSLMSQFSNNAKTFGTDIPTVSSQTIISCTSNPHNCGGTGGCEGATPELVFDLVKSRGVPLAITWPYQSKDGTNIACNDAAFNTVKLGIKGYTVLPSNKLAPLKHALVSNGSPVVVAVDATNWNYYISGIYQDGKGDFTVNHAVTLMGYKEKDDSSLGYWLIKNSWGESFGENGYIRIEMKENEESHCGWDEDTHIGLACDGDPDRAWVCGTCGILYDSSFPTGLYMRQ